MTLPAVYLDRVARSRDSVAFLTPGEPSWTPHTWGEIDRRVRAVALGLRSLGGERCAIISGTRLDACSVTLGAVCGGLPITQIYSSNTAAQCEAILRDCEPRSVIVEDAEQRDKVASVAHRLPSIRHIVQIDGQEHAGVMSLDRLIAIGRGLDAQDPAAFVNAARSVGPEVLATIVYTSGTTGDPKGVELTHRSWVYAIEAVASLGALSEQDLHHFWLPLAHSFGLLMLFLQMKVGFASAVDGRLEGFTAKLKQVRPTVVCAVPRLLERAQAQIVTRVAEQPSPTRQIGLWALRLAERRARARRGNRPVRPSDPAYLLADRLVLSKLRAEFGGRVRFFLCGGAALNPDVAYFFEGIGIPALEGYGSTEAGAGSFVNRPDAMRVGTVGLPLPGTEVRFAGDGEILIKSPAVMRGYWRNSALTADALTPDGWLRMGDVGRLDADGFLVITDRKKDLIKTAGGKSVAPQYIEARLKSLCALLGHVVVHGDGRKFCSALMTLELDAARAWARERGIAGDDHATLARHARVRGEIGAAIDALNAQVASYEAIRAFDVLDEPLSLEAGELTPNAKMRRRAVETRHRARLDALYENHAAPIGEPSDAEIARFLETAKTIAVVGLGSNVLRESYRVSAALKLRGFRIVPVHPTATRVLGERAYRTLAEIPFAVDAAVVFRRSQFAAGHIEEALASGIPAVWLQEGVIDHEASQRARRRGLFVVEDRCLLKTHRRLRSAS